MFASPPPPYDPAKAMAYFDSLTADQKAKLSVGIMRAGSDPKVTPELEKTAIDAAKAVGNVDDMFITLRSTLARIGDTEKFLATFDTLKEKFRKVVSDSDTLSGDIGHYAESFDVLYIKMAVDPALSVEDRTKEITKFISEGNSIESRAETMRKRFEDLKDEFGDFTKSFSDWAKPREEADEKRITEIDERIRDIDQQLKAINIALTTIGATLALTLPITAILSALFPPAAPIIMTIGCSFAGLETGSLVGLTIARNNLTTEKDKLDDEKTTLAAQVKDIKKTRTELQATGDANLKTFIDNIEVLQGVWRHVRDDAQDILRWLNDGADPIKIKSVTYLETCLKYDIEIYKAMGKYLKTYQNAVHKTAMAF
ncbi:hypothetical protein FB451DRAFT_1246687 [Mycena latifolia]|nr:hypothetical protein FB451DRAFT_1246687 [Mycena latifolia]